MTVYVVFKTARQVDGEYVFISAEKAFTEEQKAEIYWRSAGVSLWREEIMIPSSFPGHPPEKILCQCERAIHSVEVE
jgi:hypothetical protein